jgi:hypothetical protein
MSTVTITAADINKLRQMTGAGMMDCRKALTETNGDIEAAIDWLRKKGQKVAALREDLLLCTRIYLDESLQVSLLLRDEPPI